VRPANEDAKLTDDEQRVFRTGVGMLLYLVKHSRPDLANPTRELSKVMDGATESHFNELKRVIKYALGTKDMGLKIKPQKLKDTDNVWLLKGLSDSDFSGDRKTRLSVTGYIVHFMGVPVAWKSKAQRNVSLSSTEAEYYAVSEVVKEIKFIAQMHEFLEVKVNYPIRVYVDNVGAIFLANNKTSSQRTKHVDVRYHFIRQYIEEGKIIIEFVRSENNDADLMTKNVSGDIHERHRDKMLLHSAELETG
jgi:hypothetical protein